MDWSRDNIGDLNFHLSFIELLALTCFGKNTYAQEICQSVIPIHFVMEVIANDTLDCSLRKPYLKFLNDVNPANPAN
jgi:hypothetical protein